MIEKKFKLRLCKEQYNNTFNAKPEDAQNIKNVIYPTSKKKYTTAEINKTK